MCRSSNNLPCFEATAKHGVSDVWQLQQRKALSPPCSRAVEQFDNSQQCNSFCTSGRSRTDHAATTHVARETNLFTVPAKPVVSASPTSPGFRNRIMSFEMRFSYPRPDYPMPKLRRGKFEVCVNFSSDRTQFLINFRVQNSLMLLLKNLYC